MRWRVDASYRQQTLGTADDALDADGVHSLSFSQAITAARTLVNTERAERLVKAAGPVPTVRTAIEEYIAEREEREHVQLGGIGLKRDCRSRLSRHVLSRGSLADRPLHTLTDRDLISWRDSLPGTLAASTQRRLVNDLKAALNRAARRGRAQLPPTFEREVKGGLASDQPTSPVARHMQILSDDEVREVIAAAWKVDERDDWEGSLGQLVVVLAATGARFSQAARMTVADLQVAQRRILVPTSRKGRGVKVITRIAVPVGDDVLMALRPAVRDRRATEVLLTRPRWRQLSPTRWTKVGVGGWHSSSEILRPWKAVIAEAGLPPRTVPYALRHSSIVRALRVGLPARLVAATHDTSLAMVESHYSAHVVSALEELSARSVIPLTKSR